MAGVPLLSGRDYMRGPGVDSSGAAIQLPATAPIGPTAAVNAAANSPALQAPAVAGMGVASMLPPNVPPGGLSQGASVGGIGRFLFGDTAINAAQQANTQADQGNMARALGSGVRAVAAAAANPYVTVAQGLGNVGHLAAGAVNDFASGLMGGASAAAAPAQAAPAQAPAPQPAPFQIQPGPRPGVGVIRSGNRIDYVSTQDANAPAAVPQFIPRPGVDNAAPGTVTDLSGGMMRNPAYQASAAPAAAAAPQQTQQERELGLEAGTVAKSIHDAPPSKRPELISLYSGLRGPAQQNAVRGQVLQMFNDKYHSALGEAGADDVKQKAARAEMLKDLLSIVAPSSFSAGYLPGSLQAQN